VLAKAPSPSPTFCEGKISAGRRSHARAAGIIVDLFEQFLFQMPARGFFDRAPFGSDGLLVGLALFARAIVDLARQMRNSRAVRADFALVRLGVRIHARTLPDVLAI